MGLGLEGPGRETLAVLFLFLVSSASRDDTHPFCYYYSYCYCLAFESYRLLSEGVESWSHRVYGILVLGGSRGQTGSVLVRLGHFQGLCVGANTQKSKRRLGDETVTDNSLQPGGEVIAAALRGSLLMTLAWFVGCRLLGGRGWGGYMGGDCARRSDVFEEVTEKRR